MLKNCLQCTKEFKTSPSRIRINQGKYCSKRCGYDAHIGVQFGKVFPKGHSPWNKGTKGLMPVPWIKLNKGSTKISQENAHQWKGENVSYSGLHRWLKKYFGKANKCENPKCIYPRKDKKNRLMLAPKRYEWANVSGKYRRDRNDFMQLCVSCHKFYDHVI